MSESNPGLMTIFNEALERSEPAARAEYLDRACGGDAELRKRVEELLAAHAGAGRFLEPGATGAFEEPTQLAPGATAAFEPQAPPRTDLLTGAYQPDSGADAPPTGQAAAAAADTVIAGRYTLVEGIGEGGMGSVYLASQTEPVRRQVALKLIKSGMDSKAVLARFDAERQALALMDHPNIARIYDGGVTAQGQPFFVMELVQGVPLTDYCDHKRLSVKARLELFVQVCQAVQHAHQKGIIHRDLKPGNVLVTEVDGRPTPKVIDFGVAKATEQKLTDMSFADVGAIVGTPAYMSPEQAEPGSMDIDTRSDVYALGVILYELLTGSPPLDASQFKRGALLEMLRMVREVEPPRPSTRLSTADGLPNIAAKRSIEPAKLAKLLQGELDWVVMKAIEKDRGRRYDTALGLGQDIQRYLADEVVEARPPSRGYRLRKFVRRNKVQVIAASLVLFALVAGMTGTTLGLVQAQRSAESERQAKLRESERAEGERQARLEAEAKRQEAERNLAFAKKGNALLGSVFTGLDPQKIAESGRPLQDVLRENLGQAVKELEGSAIGAPLEVAEMQYTLGTSLLGLGEAKLAVEVFQKSLATRKARLGPDHPDTLQSMNNLAAAYADSGQVAKAVSLNEETLAKMKAKLGPDHPHTLQSMNNLAAAYEQSGQLAKAVPLFEESLAKRKAKLGPDHPDTLKSMNNLANAYLVSGQGAKAVPLYEETLAKRKSKLGPDHPQTLASMNNLAEVYRASGQLAKAVPLYEESLAKQKAKLGPDHPDTLTSMNNLALAYQASGQLAKAVSLNEETLAKRKAKLGPDHPDTLASMNNLAIAYYASGQVAKALSLHEETLAKMKAKLGPDHPHTLQSMNNLAAAYEQSGHTDKALPLRAAKDAAHPKDTLLTLKVAALQVWFGQDKDYESTVERALRFAKGTQDPSTAERMAKVCSLRPCTDKARLDASLALARLAAKNGQKNPYVGYFRMALGMAEYRSGNYTAAEQALRAAVKGNENNPHIAHTSALYRAMSLFRQGKKEEAKALATQAVAKMKPLPKDEKNPLANGANADDLILWLAYNEARKLIGFDPSKPERKP